MSISEDANIAPPWPWRELNELSDRLYAELREAVTRILREAGEDGSNPQLLALRCVQVAYGISGAAERDSPAEAEGM